MTTEQTRSEGRVWAEAMRHLDRTSVAGEHLESESERTHLDSIDDPDNRQVDHLILRALSLATDLGLGGLVESELEELCRQLRMRFSLAELIATGEILEWRRQDGRYEYRPSGAGPEGCAGEAPSNDPRKDTQR